MVVWGRVAVPGNVYMPTTGSHHCHFPLRWLLPLDTAAMANCPKTILVLKKQRKKPRSSGRHVSPIHSGAIVNISPIAIPSTVRIARQEPASEPTIHATASKVNPPVCRQLLQDDPSNRDDGCGQDTGFSPVPLEQGCTNKRGENLTGRCNRVPGRKIVSRNHVRAVRNRGAELFLKRGQCGQLTPCDHIEALHDDTSGDPETPGEEPLLGLEYPPSMAEPSGRIIHPATSVSVIETRIARRKPVSPVDLEIGIPSHLVPGMTISS
jgi:hypothetical protein